MKILTPNPRYAFTTRDGSPSDEAVIRETWCENVYQIHPEHVARRGAVVVDIGANIGAVTVYAASLGQHVRVLAVEPERDNLNLLMRNVADNNVEGQVTFAEIAISKTAGMGWIMPGHGHSLLGFEPGTGDPIRVASLAELFAENDITECDVLKVDVEGAEYGIIAGADRDTLAKVRYLTLEFDAAPDDVFGPLVAKLAKTHGIQILGSPERGGYIYARRY
ncbi:FkbM family methyltransferase [Nocardia otitidiscaviarum]|uniref:FkbM family methyltransferase n=1 Tax=Nocardia otitidiscaviarum TaxID=1823 RepID=UPI0004A7553F|nr:FkbM family methyltransferase [Nocardia otitidiscaviarum]